MIALILIGVVLYYTHGIVINFDDIKAQGIEAYTWMNLQNEFATAGISLWILGVITYLAKDIPRKIWIFMVKQITVTLTLNNCDDVYYDFLNWYHRTGRSKKSRTLVATGRWSLELDRDETYISSGYGLHFFGFGGKLFKFQREEKDASQTKETKESITLVTIGRSQEQFLSLIEEITPQAMESDVTDIYKWSGDRGWRRYVEQASRSFESVIIPQEKKQLITDHLDTFLSERDWYIGNGIPYRTGMVFHGIPGSGKTSLVRGLCERLKKPLYLINLNAMTDDKLEEAFADLPRGSIVLMEDIDTYSVTNDREVSEKKSKKDIDLAEVLGGLTLSGLLNAIDGIMASDGRILIATTNNIGALDDALIRKGRFNLLVDIGYLTDGCFRQFFTNFYPNFPISPKTKFKDEMSPAELQALIIDNRDDAAYVLSQCIQPPILAVAKISE